MFVLIIDCNPNPERTGHFLHIKMQMSWIAHGLCNDREAADLICKNSKRIAEPIASDESVADKAKLP